MPAQIQGNTSTTSVPPSHTSSSINNEIPNPQPMQEENQIPQPTQPGDPQPEDQHHQRIYGRKSNKYWTVDVIDEAGVRTERRLKVHDWFVLPAGKKVVLEWNENGQPIGEAGDLLGGVLGAIAANFEDFPISSRRWPKVPSSYKKKVWKYPIKAKFDVNDEGHKKYIFENIGKKWRDNRLFAEYYDETLSLEENLESRPDGMSREQWDSFLNYRLSEDIMEMAEKMQKIDKSKLFPIHLGRRQLQGKNMNWKCNLGEVILEEKCILLRTPKTMKVLLTMKRNKSAELDEKLDDPSFEKDAYVEVFGKEHPGRVRGMGFGVTPTQVFGPTYRYGSSSSSSSASPSSAEFENMKLELQASKETVAVLKQQVAKVPTLEAQVAFLMQQFGGQFPSTLNQAPDLGSPAEMRRYSNASHDLPNDGHGFTP